MKKNETIAEASVALIVSGDELDMEELTACLRLQPTRIIHKGEVVGRIPAPLLAGQDQWIYTCPLTETYDADTTLISLLTDLQQVKDELHALSATGNTVTLQLYVKSDHAHMFYRLMPETLTHLVALGIPLEISSFSWGGL